jgi:hypothetical protein
MGAELAVTATSGGVSLNNFNDTVLLKLNLRHGNWAIFGRVAVTNGDPDRQYISARLLRNVNVVIDFVQSYGEFVEAEIHGTASDVDRGRIRNGRPIVQYL